MNNPKKKSNVNKSMIVRDSLTNISISDPDKDKEAVYPIKRKTIFIDLDKSVESLVSRGWKGLSKSGKPNTTDTVMFKGEEIIPVEIKSRTQEKVAGKAKIKNLTKNLSKKLLTFVANVYQLDNKEVQEYWIITNFMKKEDIIKDIKTNTITLMSTCSWIEDKPKLKEVIEKIKVRHFTIKDFEKKNLGGYNRSPKWFIDSYESQSVSKIKPKAKVSKDKDNTKTRVIKALKAKGEPTKAPKAKNNKSIKAKVVKEPKAKVSKPKDNKELSLTISEFQAYKQQQAIFQNKLLNSINALTKEITELRKSKKK